MGKLARLGILCLMGVAIGVARLIEVELVQEPLPTAAQAAAPEAPAALIVAPLEAAPPAPVQAPPPERVHVVQKGETLGRISQVVYGTTRHWERILKANRDVIPNPKRMRPGMRLKIPTLEGSNSARGTN